MAVTTFFTAEAITTESKTNFIQEAWNRLERVPGGKLLYSRMVGRLIPNMKVKEVDMALDEVCAMSWRLSGR